MTDIDDDWDEYDDYEPDPDPDLYDDREPDEPDWSYDAWGAAYEEHCEQAHGGDDCTCRPPLAGRLRQALRDMRLRAVSALRRRPRYSDEPPF